MLKTYDPRKVVPDIIDVLAKHKVTLRFVDTVFNDVRQQLQFQTVQSDAASPEVSEPLNEQMDMVCKNLYEKLDKK